MVLRREEMAVMVTLSARSALKREHHLYHVYGIVYPDI